MNSYDISPLAPTFGSLVQAHEGAGLPDPEGIMALFCRDGAVLLRGFPFTVDTFVAFSDKCCSNFSTYVGGGSRFRALDRTSLGAGGTLMSTTGKTQSFPIPLHGEMYYQKDRPEMLWFYCAHPPSARGQTTLASGREVFARLSVPGKALLRERRLLYVRELRREDWQTSYRTTDVDELRRICELNETSLEVRADQSIRAEYRSSALKIGPDGKETFINNALLLWQFERALQTGQVGKVLGGDVPEKMPLVVRLDDGSELPESLMSEVDRVCEELTQEVGWQHGDTVLVDNRHIMHGRRKSPSDVRQIMVRMGTPRLAAG